MLTRGFSVLLFASLFPLANMEEPLVTLPVPTPQVHMVASYYGPGFEGRVTASGRVFNSEALTAAHRTLPFGTRLRLTNPRTKASVTVEIIDRGPYSTFDGVHYYAGSRDLDVSEGVARELGFKHEGIATLEVQLTSAAYPPPPQSTTPRSGRATF